MQMAGIAYGKQAAVLEELKANLVHEVDRRRALIGRGSHKKALIAEEIRFQKELLRERGKVKALEEQLETPINVHRWRFIESGDPEKCQLIKMSHELRDRLMLKITQLARLRRVKKKYTNEASSLENHLANSYNGTIQDEFEFLSETLRQKSRQLIQISERVRGQTGTVLERKDGVMTMRTMLREEKSEYFDAKKKVDEIRASTAIGVRPREIDQNVESENHYIGGGFAVAGTIKATRFEPEYQTPVPLAAMGRTGVTTPKVVEPRCVSAMQKHRPRGWSPSRGPLQPKLPTARNLSRIA
jgi:hypothetical protein